jgi:hypothetical protein
VKPFQPRTLEQQKKSYIKACKQRLAAELNGLTDRYREDHETHAKLYFNRCRLVEKADKIQARVADAADKEFGGWDTWRHDEKLLRLVSARMDDAACDLLFKIEGIDQRMEMTMRSFHKDCKAVTNKYYALIKTA